MKPTLSWLSFIAILVVLLSIDQIHGTPIRGTLSYTKFYEPTANSATNWRVEYNLQLIIRYSFAWEMVSSPPLQIGSTLRLLLALSTGNGNVCGGGAGYVLAEVLNINERDDYIVTQSKCNMTYDLINIPAQGITYIARASVNMRYPPNNNWRYTDFGNFGWTAKVFFGQAEASSGISNNPPQRISPGTPAANHWSHIIEVPVNTVNFQYSVLASDPSGESITYRLANISEMGTFGHPSGMSIDSNTGQVTLALALSPGVWATQTIVTDSWGNHIAMDYILVIKPITCGNDIVEASASEQCEPSQGICCFSWCKLKTGDAVCRFSNSNCDVPEQCIFNNGSCPANKFKAAGFRCRSFDGNAGCDLDDVCNGVNDVCPDTIAVAGQLCRGILGDCDIPEYCSGSSINCPADQKYTTSKVCRLKDGDCDKQETCDGYNNACPNDTFEPNTFVCRGPMGDCDMPDKCTGSSKLCPTVDLKKSSSVVCRNATGLCDIPENCTGSSNSCPDDLVSPSGQICRLKNGTCDVEDTCNGVSPSCNDIVKPLGSLVCRPAAGDCDIDEVCNGILPVCPPNIKKLNDIVCRVKNGSCDLEERCNGISDWCPTNGYAPATTECRPASGYCDVAEYCSGFSTECPAGTISNPNLLVNANFELNSCDFEENDFCKYYSVDTTNIQGWTVSNGNVEILSNEYYISDASIDLASSSLELNGVSAGVVKQTVNTRIGITYTFSMWYSANPTCTAESDKLKTFSARVGNSIFTKTHNVTGRSLSNMGWTYFTSEFIADSTQTIISFTSEETSPCGNIIDLIGFRIKNLILNPKFDIAPTAYWCSSTAQYCTAKYNEWTYNKIPSWIVESGSVDVTRYWAPHSNPISIDMNGEGPGVLSQVISIPIPNQLYVLSFYMAGNPGTTCLNPKTRTMNVTLDYWTNSYMYDVTGSTNSNLLHGSRSAVIFLGNITTAKLTFISTRTIDSCGVAIDTVSLSPHCPDI